jgi:hypothetical protein
MHKTDQELWRSLTQEQRENRMRQTQSAAYKEWMGEEDWPESQKTESAWRKAQLQTEFQSSENWRDSLNHLVAQDQIFKPTDKK